MKSSASPHLDEMCASMEKQRFLLVALSVFDVTGGIQTMLQDLIAVSRSAGVRLSILSLYDKSMPEIGLVGCNGNYLLFSRKLFRYSPFTVVLWSHIRLLRLRSLTPMTRRNVLLAYGTEIWGENNKLNLKKLLLKIDSIWAISNFTSKKLVELASADPAIIRLWPSFSHLRPLDKNSASPHDSSGKLKIITVMRLGYSTRKLKSITYVFDAIRKLKKRSCILFEVYGDGEYRSELEAQASDLISEGVVRFKGYIDDLSTAYSGADLVSLVSPGEGLGIALIDGLSFGIPGIASKDCGAEDVIQNGFNGYTVDPNSPQQLTLVLEKILSDRSHLEKLRINAYQSYCNKFTQDAFTNNTVNLLRSQCSPLKTTKIYFIAELPMQNNNGGAFTVSLNLLRYARVNGLDISTIVPVYDRSLSRSSIEFADRTIRPFFIRRTLSDPIVTLHAAFAVIITRIKKRNALIYIDTSPILAFILDALGYKTCVFLHGATQKPTLDVLKRSVYSFIIDWLSYLSEKYLITRSVPIMTNSNHSKARLLEASSGQSAGNVRAFRLGADIGRMRSETLDDEDRAFAEQNCLLDTSQPYACFVGGLSHNKNPLELVDITSRVVNKYPNFRFFYVGKPGNATNQVLNLVNELQLTDHFIWLGSLSNMQLGLVMGNACFYISTAYEGFGINQVEAMQFGLPLIARNRGAVSELFVDSKHGYLCESTAEIVEASLQLLNCHQRRQELSDQASAYALSTFSWDTFAQKCFKFIHEFSQ